ncbi:hypothetical protein HY990_01100 [Candidatus Micrarchaeota archaeon]|nr:hypothetical protein [Candidatus Micrarchaeota archaeon]
MNCTDIIEASQKYKNQKLLLDLRDYAFDEGAVKLLAEKKKACILINLGRVIRARGIARAILISKIRSLLRLANRYGAAYAFATLAQEEQEIRNAHELISIGTLFGINRGQAKFAIRMLGEYLTEKKEEEIVIEKD